MTSVRFTSVLRKIRHTTIILKVVTLGTDSCFFFQQTCSVVTTMRQYLIKFFFKARTAVLIVTGFKTWRRKCLHTSPLCVRFIHCMRKTHKSYISLYLSISNMRATDTRKHFDSSLAARDCYNLSHVNWGCFLNTRCMRYYFVGSRLLFSSSSSFPLEHRASTTLQLLRFL
jgi:hypothetical protein